MSSEPAVATLAAEANGGMTKTYIGVVIVEILVLVALAAMSAWFR